MGYSEEEEAGKQQQRGPAGGGSREHCEGLLGTVDQAVPAASLNPGPNIPLPASPLQPTASILVPPSLLPSSPSIPLPFPFPASQYPPVSHLDPLRSSSRLIDSAPSQRASVAAGTGGEFAGGPRLQEGRERRGQSRRAGPRPLRYRHRLRAPPGPTEPLPARAVPQVRAIGAGSCRRGRYGQLRSSRQPVPAGVGAPELPHPVPGGQSSPRTPECCCPQPSLPFQTPGQGPAAPPCRSPGADPSGDVGGWYQPRVGDTRNDPLPCPAPAPAASDRGQYRCFETRASCQACDDLSGPCCPLPCHGPAQIRRWMWSKGC